MGHIAGFGYAVRAIVQGLVIRYGPLHEQMMRHGA
jgi:hypothetical protein